MAIAVAAVVTQFGAYYINNPDNMKRLRNMLYLPADTATYFQERPGDDTVYRGVLATLNRIVQPFQKAFTPIGTITFEPNQFPLFKIKVDMSETPDDLEATYLGFLASQPEADRAQWLFIRWLIEVHVMAKIQQDLELNEYFKGVYAAPTPNTAGAAGTAMDGIRKVIRGYNTAGRLNLKNGPQVLGAIPTDPVECVTYLEKFADGIPSVFRSKLDAIFVAPEVAIRYKRGKREKYNLNYAQTNDLQSLEDYPKIKVVGLESHAGSGLVWTSLPENRIRATKKAVLGNTMKVESAKRVVDLLTDWWESLNFEVPEFVFTNDQDLV
ncbi:hypothetical protein SAMN05444008_11565 [Cnuella takakiae]|uniref:Uncharacterized protein n=1 Tax=Cnuella takakiae TaxID=1302690 RepID=A0A1M5G1T6_9BACT|nr:hypothetical protein [Cnuella takakiae]OLY92299.1 hypothetical protein BUE76_10635 [Cnuella takakiae]SHF97683.1 hypothetical protein SAMN05444008_11565 [Cnuella takakiae]